MFPPNVGQTVAASRPAVNPHRALMLKAIMAAKGAGPKPPAVAKPAAPTMPKAAC
jgi:hypothetical protein